jgi:hypothetical protein
MDSAHVMVMKVTGGLTAHLKDLSKAAWPAELMLVARYLGCAPHA